MGRSIDQFAAIRHSNRVYGTDSRLRPANFRRRFVDRPESASIWPAQTVADASYREDVDGPLGVRLDLLAQGADVDA